MKPLKRTFSVPGEKWDLSRKAKKLAPPLLLVVLIYSIPFWEGALKQAFEIKFVLVLRTVGIYTLVALGLNLLLGYAGQISLGHAAFMGIGAYASAIISSKGIFGVHPSVYLSIPLAVGITALVALMIAPVLRLKGHYLALATLGFGLVVFVLIRELKELTGGNTGLFSLPKLPLPFVDLSSFKQTQVWKIEYFIIWTVALLMIIFARNLVESRPGRALQALHQTEVAAEAVGVDTTSYKSRVFVLSAALAGLAGALFAHTQGSLSPKNFGLAFSINLLVMVVIGGMASVWGCVAGASFVVLLPEFVNNTLPYWLGRGKTEMGANVEGIIFGVALILVMILMPSGLTRGLSDLVRHRRNPLRNPFRREEGM
jgi:branched-chain amino acid transport system permease protein